MAVSPETQAVLQQVIRYAKTGDRAVLESVKPTEWERALVEYSEFSDGDHYRMPQIAANFMQAERQAEAERTSRRRAIISSTAVRILTGVVVGVVLAVFVAASFPERIVTWLNKLQ